MRHRSEWFLSDPTGLVTVKCRPTSMVMPVAEEQPLVAPSGPFSLPCSRPPPLPSSQPPSAITRLQTPASLMGSRLSPNISCDKTTSISCNPTAMLASTSLPKANDVRLRRRLSDKDKDRRVGLVRRSSSKRKDKENGSGEAPDSPAISGAATANHSQGQSAVATSADESSADINNRASLKRTASVESSNVNVGSNNNNHALLCRTRSEDATASAGEALEAGLTRSLPRI
jgi:hypothetical protein